MINWSFDGSPSAQPCRRLGTDLQPGLRAARMCSQGFEQPRCTAKTLQPRFEVLLIQATGWVRHQIGFSHLMCCCFEKKEETREVQDKSQKPVNKTSESTFIFSNHMIGGVYLSGPPSSNKDFVKFGMFFRTSLEFHGTKFKMPRLSTDRFVTEGTLKGMIRRYEGGGLPPHPTPSLPLLPPSPTPLLSFCFLRYS